MPYISTGFWVARTKNGRGSSASSLPIVTVCSCIASSRALWVRGAARLISSAITRLAKIGPAFETQLGAALRRCFCTSTVGAGDVGGHQVGRELDACRLEVEAGGERAGERRLAEPGDALEQRVPAGDQADQHAADGLALADDRGRDLALDRRDLRRKCAAARSASTSSVPGCPANSGCDSGNAPLPMSVVTTGAPSRSASSRNSAAAPALTTPPPA